LGHSPRVHLFGGKSENKRSKTEKKKKRRKKNKEKKEKKKRSIIIPRRTKSHVSEKLRPVCAVTGNGASMIAINSDKLA
jgi:hypothetical protein